MSQRGSPRWYREKESAAAWPTTMEVARACKGSSHHLGEMLRSGGNSGRDVESGLGWRHTAYPKCETCDCTNGACEAQTVQRFPPGT